ncbi:MAG: diaminopimelate epimerase [Lachnospiraceae bacterium]|nr:diaminopimelate epimerase [Lachnospiraceae bacterium]
MKFTKMQGAGNDYVYINGFTEKISQEDKPDWVRKVSDRHFGIGSDGAIFINPSDEADFEMEMYNADGTRSEMCGNGMRCVGKFVYDKGLTDKTQFTVVSAGKIKYLDLTIENGKATQIKVNMGEPILEAKQVPVVSENEQVIDEPIFIPELEKNYRMTCVSMGNPHAIVFMEDVKNLEIEKIGPYFENHERFPNRTNTEFVKVLDRNNVQMRVWERGTGETLACGTGCCATAVACILNGFTDDEVTVHVLGGKIKIFWNREENVVYMTGPAETVFEGEI